MPTFDDNNLKVKITYTSTTQGQTPNKYYLIVPTKVQSTATKPATRAVSVGSQQNTVLPLPANIAVHVTVPVAQDLTTGQYGSYPHVVFRRPYAYTGGTTYYFKGNGQAIKLNGMAETIQTAHTNWFDVLSRLARKKHGYLKSKAT